MTRRDIVTTTTAKEDYKKAIESGKKLTQRRYKRVPVQWEADCLMGDLFMSGSVLDLSPHGLFFSPQLIVDPNSAKQKQKHNLERGDELNVQIGSWDNIKCEVKWTGQSDKHGCEGFGVEFLESDFSKYLLEETPHFVTSPI